MPHVMSAVEGEDSRDFSSAPLWGAQDLKGAINIAKSLEEILKLFIEVVAYGGEQRKKTADLLY